MAKIKNMEKTEKKKIKKNKKFKVKHYPCSYCSKTFSERAGRDHHLQLHSSERPFSCSLCPHTCKTKKYLAKHVRVVHKPPTSFKCEYCDKMFHYKCLLDKHIVVHTNSKPHKCKQCGKGFNSQYSLRSHTLIHKNLKPFKCKFCEYACRDSSTLRRHQERHMGIVRRYDCNICDKRFSKKQILQYHVAEVHMKVNLKKIPCGQCDKMFRTKKLLKIHVEVRHNRKFATTCEICGLKLANKYNMNSHLMSHVNVRPFKCVFSGCDKRYKDRSSLQKHSIIHYPEKQFPCKICGKKFTRKERLRRHKKQHVARVKNVQCDYCGVCFYNKNYLSVHILKKHSRRKKKYICDMCDFESGNKPGLIIHIKGHNMKMDKECPICTKKYKQENWLKLHLWHTHKVMESTGTPVFETDIKVEPIDVDGTPEFELFEIEKEELLDELHSTNKETNPEQNSLTKETIKDGNEIEEENENLVLTRPTESLKDYNNFSQHKGSSQAISKETDYTSNSLQKNNVDVSTRQKCSKEDLSVNENLRIPRHNSVDNLTDADNNLKKLVISNEFVANNYVNGKNMSHFNSILINNNDILDNSEDDIAEDENATQNPENQDSTKAFEQDDRVQDDLYYKTIPAQDIYKEIDNVKEIKSKVHKSKVGSSKRKSLAYVKSRIKDEKKKRVQKNAKYLGDYSKKSNSSKRTSLAHIKEVLLDKKQRKNNIKINSENISGSEELDQGLEYSKTVLSEDITRCITQRKKKYTSEKKFDDLFIDHIVGRSQKSNKKVLEIDIDCQSYAKNYVDRLLEKTRNDNEVKFIEKTRQQYNERIRKARKTCPEKISIKYFDKTSPNNGIIKTNNQDENNARQDRYSHINNENEKDCILETEKSTIKYDYKHIHEDKREKTDCLNDCDNPTEENVVHGNEKEVNTQWNPSSNKEFGDDNQQSQNRNDTVNEQDKKGTNKIHLRSNTVNKKRFDDHQSCDDDRIHVDEYRKIKLNTHQCYVCFKLFESKGMLLDHCKDHFVVCNSTILKKCPLCDFATKLNIVQHLKVAHDVEITIPSTRIIDKESDNGPRYCYKVNSAIITDIDVIPSVKHLNKQAYIAIDKKNRKLKDTGIGRTKLVKKGNEWIVERKTTKIDNVDEFILPEFDVDEILSIKIDSNDYLSRMKKLYRLAKKHKKQMLFPCESCDKICQTLSALKLHYRRHDPMSKPFKKKVWKHKMKDFIQPTNKKVTDIDYGKKKYSRVVEIDKKNCIDINVNRYKKPKPVVNKHKCDPKLIKFYETNIKGGDVEFWQFLKIFNKMSRENVNDFDDLHERPEFGIHMDETNPDNRTEGSADVNDNEKEVNLKINEKIVNIKNRVKDDARHTYKTQIKNGYKRIIRISKREHQRRNDLKQRLRDKIAREILNT